jgi:hypothetical protein
MSRASTAEAISFFMSPNARRTVAGAAGRARPGPGARPVRLGGSVRGGFGPFGVPPLLSPLFLHGCSRQDLNLVHLGALGWSAYWLVIHNRRTEDPGASRREEGDPDRHESFTSIMLPGLATLSMTAIAKATGMSATAAGKVRSGQRVPHQRHWEALADLVGPGPMFPRFSCSTN